MSKKTVGVGVIGYGARLRGLIRNLPGLGEQIRLVAGCDPAEPSRKWIAEDAGEGKPKIHDDYHDLVRDPKVDWVAIGSYNALHREHAVAAFEAGKHVFCEKPLATTLEDCVAMREAWQASGKTFAIGFTLRYSPHYRRIRSLVEEGAVGEILSMEFNETLDFNHGGFIHSDWRRLRELAGTHLLEKCCHDIDLANWIVDSLAARVASFGGCDFFKPENAHHIERLGRDKHGRAAYGTWRSTTGLDPFTADKDVVDNQVAIVEYVNRVRATFHTNCNAGIPERRMYILGTEGAIRADVLKGEIQHKRIGFDAEIEEHGGEGVGGHGGGDDYLRQTLADCMTQGAEPATGLEDGLRSAVTCFGIDQAMDSGVVVDMAPLWRQAGVEA